MSTLLLLATLPSATAAVPLKLEDATMRGRFISLEGTTCSLLTSYQGSASGWSAAPLSQHDTLSLAGYCVYEYTDDPFQGDGGNDVQSWLVLNGAYADVALMMPLASAGEIRDGLRNEFRFEAGYPLSPLPVDGDVTLAILDTHPAGGDSTPPSNWSKHGYILSTIAEELLLCDTGTCTISQYRALPLVFHSDKVLASPVDKGGYFGGFVDLIRSLEDAFADRSGDMVYNLSLGWTDYSDGQYGGGSSSTWEPVVTALYDLLQEVRCDQGLIFASVGNHIGGGIDPVEVLLPAAWGTDATHDIESDSCGDGASYPTEAAPLVYPVSGTGRDDHPLPLAREEMELVAYGEHAIGTHPTHGVTAALAGTSVSTMLVSTSATALWAGSPLYTPEDVVKVLIGTPAVEGEALLFCEVNPSVCEEDPTDELSALFDEDDLEWALPPITYSYRTDMDCAAGADTIRTYEIVGYPTEHDTYVADSPCPTVEFHDSRAMAAIHPQPTTQDCPFCFASELPSSSDLAVYLNNPNTFDIDGEMSLYIETAGTVDVYPVPFGAVTSGAAPHQIRFILDGDALAPGIEAMSITLIDSDGEFAQTSPLFLVQ